jgi:hypothetical protein
MRLYGGATADDFYTDNIGPPYDIVRPVSDISAGSWTIYGGSASLSDALSDTANFTQALSDQAPTSAVVALAPHGTPQTGGVAKIVIRHYAS